MHIRAIVWLDHRSARILRFSAGDADVVEVAASHAEDRLHRKSGIPGSGRAPVDTAFFERVCAAIAGVREILLVGPGGAKSELRKHVGARHPDLARRLVGTETVDHPSDGELMAYARAYFARIDRLGVD